MLSKTHFDNYNHAKRRKIMRLTQTTQTWITRRRTMGTQNMVVLVEPHQHKKKQGNCEDMVNETQFSTKIGGKTSLGPSYFVL
jgi:hypothetical protein